MVDGLFAAIADYLRQHNRRLLTPCPPPVPLAERRTIEGIWGALASAPRCRRCAWPILSGDGALALERLRAVRLCAHCARDAGAA